MYLMRGPNLRIQYHDNVSGWASEQIDGVATWRRDWTTLDQGPIQYSDRNADGRIDTRFEQKREYAIVSFDRDHDGLFEEQWVQRLSNVRVYAANVSPIQRPVPDAIANEPPESPSQAF
ncbi:hypothetical protein RISK_000550 [Rhodopirellula islandica]|uniref:Uncharacterized protein n=2 Tax=Rhodopirellula islandica TaxID=595434 RepID=A0A0J1BLX1_RHOIS|nr:hypothetical protein RISK_000550 [Rhodopirellula islandica]